MARILAYTSPAVGHLYPLVGGSAPSSKKATRSTSGPWPRPCPELDAVGIDGSPVAAGVLDVPVTDYLARGGRQRLVAGLRDVLRRGAVDGDDLESAIAEHHPDLLLVDINAYGALTRAEASGLPWAMTMPSLLAAARRRHPAVRPRPPPGDRTAGPAARPGAVAAGRQDLRPGHVARTQ